MLQIQLANAQEREKNKYRVTINLSCFDATPSGGQQGRALQYFKNPHNYMS